MHDQVTPRFRISIRSLLVIVAACALLIALGFEIARLSFRSGTYRRIAREHELEAARLRIMYDTKANPKYSGLRPNDVVFKLIKKRIPRMEKIAKYQDAMKVKYDHLADHPWLEAPADPPSP